MRPTGPITALGQLSPNARKVVAFLTTARNPKAVDVAKHVCISSGAAGSLLRNLRRHGIVEASACKLTAKGAVLVRAAEPAPTRKPLTRPKPRYHAADVAPLPPPALPPLPAGFAILRGVRHPLAPVGYPPPPGSSREAWRAKTSIPAMAGGAQ